jgi:hypothetical protein
MGRLSFSIPLLVIIFVISLLAGGCGSATTQTTEQTTSVQASPTSPGELDIDSALLRHVINSATTDHGKLVLGKLLVDWSHGYGHGPFQQNQDGSWMGTLSVDESKVQANELLKPIFQDPVGKKYILEWNISEDASVFTPINDNAKSLEAELGK